MKEYTVRHIGSLLSRAGVALLGLLLLLQPVDPAGLVGWFACLLLAVCTVRPQRLQPLAGVDICILLLFLYDMVNWGLSSNPLAGQPYTAVSFGTVCFYFLLRWGGETEKRMLFLLKVFSVFIGIFILISLFSFSRFVEMLSGLGWEQELSAFKYLYRPLGLLNNMWNAFAVACLGWVLTALWFCRKQKGWRAFLVLVAALLSANILLSFSRGAYVAWAVLMMGTAAVLLRRKGILRRQWRMLLLFGAVVAVCVLPFRSEIGKVLHFAGSVSQQRSIAGRMDAGQAAWQAFQEHPWVGVGAGNYSLAVDPYLFEDDDRSYTNFAPNTGVQLAVEKGGIGLLLWGVLMACFIRSFIRSRKDSGAVWIALSLLAIGVREMSFASFFEHAGMQVAVAALLAVHQNSCLNEAGKKLRMARATLLVPAACCLLLSVAGIRHHRDERWNSRAMEHVLACRLDSAAYCLEKTSFRLPYLLNRSKVCWLQYQETAEPACLQQSMAWLDAALSKQQGDVRLWHDKAVLWDCLGQRDSAKAVYARLVSRFPKNALFRVAAFEQAWRDSCREEAAEHLTAAIRLSPALLETSLWKQADGCLRGMVETRLRHESSQAQDDPIAAAKYGKIYMCLGDTLTAEHCLYSCVRALPNLMYPWLYLSQMAEARGEGQASELYRRRYAFWRREGTPEASPCGRLAEYAFLGESYEVKFNRWYRSRNCPGSIFLPLSLQENSESKNSTNH